MTAGFRSWVSCFYVCWLSISCTGTDNRHLPVYQLNKNNSFQSLGPAVFFQDIVDIEKVGQDYFFLDGTANRVYCTDSTFRYKFSFINEGDAANEARGLQAMAAYDDTLYIADVSAGKIMIFDKKGAFLQTFRTPPLGIGDLCTTANEVIFFEDEGGAASRLLRYNRQSLTFTYLALEPNDFKAPDRHVLAYGNTMLIVVFAENRPVVEIYTVEGDRLAHYDFAYLDLFQDVLTYYENKIKNDPYSDLVLIPDAFLTDNRLYLLISHRDKTGEWHANHILVCEIKGAAIAPQGIWQMDDAWYESVFVDPGRKLLILGNTADIQIDTYQLP